MLRERTEQPYDSAWLPQRVLAECYMSETQGAGATKSSKSLPGLFSRVLYFAICMVQICRQLRRQQEASCLYPGSVNAPSPNPPFLVSCRQITEGVAQKKSKAVPTGSCSTLELVAAHR